MFGYRPIGWYCRLLWHSGELWDAVAGADLALSAAVHEAGLREFVPAFKKLYVVELKIGGVQNVPDDFHLGMAAAGRQDPTFNDTVDLLRMWLKERIKRAQHRRSEAIKEIDKFGRAVEEGAYTATLLRLDELEKTKV